MVSKTIKRACQVLRYRIRLRKASLRLPGSHCGDDDTAKIWEAMELYVETWITPILDAIERGNTRDIERLIRECRGEKADDQ